MEGTSFHGQMTAGKPRPSRPSRGSLECTLSRSHPGARAGSTARGKAFDVKKQQSRCLVFFSDSSRGSRVGVDLVMLGFDPGVGGGLSAKGARFSEFEVGVTPRYSNGVELHASRT